jgi:hypothetical protein
MRCSPAQRVIDVEDDKPNVEQPKHTHEQRDVDARALVLMGVSVAVVVALTLLGMIWVFRYYAGQASAPPPSPLMAGPEIPPKPRLELNSHADLMKKLNADQEVLNSYGWVDRQTQTVRIPIERAIDLLAKRGLPVRKEKSPSSGQIPGEKTQ